MIYADLKYHAFKLTIVLFNHIFTTLWQKRTNVEIQVNVTVYLTIGNALSG